MDLSSHDSARLVGCFWLDFFPFFLDSRALHVFMINIYHSFLGIRMQFDRKNKIGLVIHLLCNFDRNSSVKKMRNWQQNICAEASILQNVWYVLVHINVLCLRERSFHYWCIYWWHFHGKDAMFRIANSYLNLCWSLLVVNEMQIILFFLTCWINTCIIFMTFFENCVNPVFL